MEQTGKELDLQREMEKKGIDHALGLESKAIDQRQSMEGKMFDVATRKPKGKE